jgi:hypothetical protein
MHSAEFLGVHGVLFVLVTRSALRAFVLLTIILWKREMSCEVKMKVRNGFMDLGNVIVTECGRP